MQIFKSQKHFSHTLGGGGGIVASQYKQGILRGLGDVAGCQVSRLCRAHHKMTSTSFYLNPVACKSAKINQKLTGCSPARLNSGYLDLKGKFC